METDKTIDSSINGFKGNYKCPKCDNTQEVNLFPYINFTNNPEYYALVKDRSIFNVKCDKCGFEQEINFDSLFVDEEHKYFIYLLSDKSMYNRFKYQITYFVETALNKENKYDLNDYKTRLVFSHNDLIEKMAIFEEGLNDETIEIIKNITYKSKLINKSVYDMLYFDGLERTKLKFIGFNSRTETVDPQVFFIDFNLYNKVIDKTKNLNARHKSFFEVIDDNWVSKFFNDVEVENIEENDK